jgi:hypothetical protein
MEMQQVGVDPNDLRAQGNSMIYESLESLGPFWSAIAAGYAVVVFGVVYVTPAGEEYLEGLS